MGGFDILTFTAGVGEKGPESREKICSYLKFLGVDIDLEKNKIRNQEVKISSENSKIEVHVVPTNEELLIARRTLEKIKICISIVSRKEV